MRKLAGAANLRGVPSRRTVVATAFAAPWAVWGLVRALGLDLGHPVVAAISFTPYAAATAWLPVVAALLLRRRRVALVAVVAAGGLAAAILPRALGDERIPEGANGPTLRVMSANLLFGNADMAALVRLARAQDVDVLSVQELTPQAVARLDAAGGRALFPSRVLVARSSAVGSGLLARLPLRDRSPEDAAVAAQPEAELRLPGAPPVRIKAVHPFPPITARQEAAWRAAIDGLPRPGAEPDGPLRVLAGDFNATLDHRVLRDLLGDGYVDAADAVGAGLVPTWPRASTRPPITIDHVLLDERIGVRSFSVHDVPGSDHRAVIAELVLPRGRSR
ncbi:MAG: endonuclease/exonuclease/phosphatase family protein [Actinomycetota bacterium]|nr:endonuclease/exonuclease/phosphatase family protein [Actinomycetota bacterium]